MFPVVFVHTVYVYVRFRPNIFNLFNIIWPSSSLTLFFVAIKKGEQNCYRFICVAASQPGWGVGGGWGCSSYLLGVTILAFGTAWGVQSKIFTFAYNTVPLGTPQSVESHFVQASDLTTCCSNSKS